LAADYESFRPGGASVNLDASQACAKDGPHEPDRHPQRAQSPRKAEERKVLLGFKAAFEGNLGRRKGRANKSTGGGGQTYPSDTEQRQVKAEQAWIKYCVRGGKELSGANSRLRGRKNACLNFDARDLLSERNR